jgi:hypothetical protein
MHVIEWLSSAFSDIEIWERNTRPIRYDDPALNQYRAVHRQAGFAVLAAFGALLLGCLWVLLGPPAGELPYRGLALIFHCVDQGLTGLVIVFTLLSVVRCYQAWNFVPERASRGRED